MTALRAVGVSLPRVDAVEKVTGRAPYPPGRRALNARLIIDATRPFGREFPAVCESPPEYQAEIVARWRDRLPEIAD